MEIYEIEKDYQGTLNSVSNVAVDAKQIKTDNWEKRLEKIHEMAGYIQQLTEMVCKQATAINQ